MKTARLTTAMILLPSVALAHPGNHAIGGLAAGLLHPVTGVDHLAAMVAVGILGAMRGGSAVWQFPLTFISMMIVGALMAGSDIPLFAVEPAIVLSSIVLGAMILLSLQPRTAISLGIVGAFALFHGHAHGAEVVPGTTWATFIMGFVASTAALHLVGVSCALAARANAATFSRLAGFTIAGVGALAGVGLI